MLKRDECNFYQLARNFLPTCAQLVARNFWHLRVTYEKLRASLDMIKKEFKDFLHATFEKLRASLLARNLFHLWPKRPLIGMALPSSNTRERQSSTLCVFHGFNCIWAKVTLILTVALVSRIFCLCVFILWPSRSPGYCRRTSGRTEQTSPINAPTSIFFFGSFSNVARTFNSL